MLGLILGEWKLLYHSKQRPLGTKNHQGLYRENGKSNGNYRNYRDSIRGYIRIIGKILELYRENVKSNGNYYKDINKILDSGK